MLLAALLLEIKRVCTCMLTPPHSKVKLSEEKRAGEFGGIIKPLARVPPAFLLRSWTTRLRTAASLDR